MILKTLFRDDTESHIEGDAAFIALAISVTSMSTVKEYRVINDD